VKYGTASSFIIIIVVVVVVVVVATGVSIWLLLELLFSNHDLSLNVGTTRVTQSRVHWWAFVNTVTNILVS
jgi:flagellar basal body-associated protein FliL